METNEIALPIPTRELLTRYKNSEMPRFEHFNIDTDGARITDRKRHMIADIYFKPNGIFCDLDKSDNCEHIDFALTVPKIQDVIRQKSKEGWKLPDI